MTTVRRIGLLAAVMATLASGCACRDLTGRLAADVHVPERPVLMIFCDGVQKARFDQLLQAGRLPNIRRYLLNGGVEVRRATTIMPSITYAVTATLLTGRTPGHHGIVDNAYFDRHKLTYRDFESVHNYTHVVDDFQDRTLYEMAPDRYGASILLPNDRGARRSFNNVMKVGAAWFLGLMSAVDSLTTLRMEQLVREANRCGRWPDFILAYYPSADDVAHRCGADSEAYGDILIHHDLEVGRLMRFLEKNGLLEKYAVVWVTDHGHTVCRRGIQAGRLFREHLGIACVDSQYDEDDSRDAGRIEYFLRLRYIMTPYDRDTRRYADRVCFFRDKRCVVVPGGKRKISVHLRIGQDDWSKRPTYEQIQSFHAPAGGRFSDRLLAEESIGLVMIRDGSDAVHVFGKDGHGTISRTRSNGRPAYAYRIVEGADPLHYVDHSPAARLVGSGPHSGQAWQEATYETFYPDVIGQTVEMFEHFRTGDVGLAAPGSTRPGSWTSFRRSCP
ncbi:MAG: Type I phosphodiesterase / nucleotide pyrophosphatase [Planctomycetes bacterium ADurb.Bin126]|nr:MAG: Type I phosphodiesterase / nucleotide pyrophosphatase [Planctomycetes bacterium ADurb.Bin126]